MISKEEVLNIANLSKLYLDESEIENAIKEMDGMINFANQINQFELSGNEEMNLTGLSNALREDEINESFPQEKILENAEENKDGFFYIAKSK